MTIECPDDVINIIQEEINNNEELYINEIDEIRAFDGLYDDWNNLIIEILDYHNKPRALAPVIFDRTKSFLKPKEEC